MKNYLKYFGFILGAAGAFGLMALVNTMSASAAGKSAAELAREQAQANPYPNDLGPQRLDADTLKSYPPEMTAEVAAAEKLLAKKPEPDHTGPMPADSGGYALMLVRCSTCHSAARPLNSRFVEVPGTGKPGTPEYKASAAAALAKLQTDHPEMFGPAAAGIWQIESDVWSRYVHRMMNKPGCPVNAVEGKKIWEFLVYDGMHRKVDDAAAWKVLRVGKDGKGGLVGEFQAKYPKRFTDLQGQNDL